MGVFEQYAAYYDLLYSDKEYQGECLYVEGLMREMAAGARDILDLGCGTGRHADILSQMGYEVHGVDISNEMLEFAASRVRRENVSFSPGDTRTVRLGRRFDVVLSLFHVMSYQLTNDDLRRSFLTAGEHLRDQGPFIFDIWYGPAVLTQRPSIRVKRYENETMSMTRIAEPALLENENRVDVHYEVIIRDKRTNQVRLIEETHRMRYLFKPEIEFILNSSGFTLCDCREWLGTGAPNLNSWSVVCLARRQ